MSRVFRKRFRKQSEGVNVAADVDAAVSVNTGASQSQSVRVKSRRRVVQRSPRAGEPQPDTPPTGKEKP